jgi:preprotein translocase subunit YajC
VDAGLLVIVALFAVFWLLLIRPQRRRQRAQDEMLTNLRVGDEIVTAGGLYGHITAIEDDEVSLEIADGVEVRVARRAVAGVMPDEDGADEADDEAPSAEDDGVEVEPSPERASKASGES